MRARVTSPTCCAPCVLFAEHVERVPGMIRSGWPARETAQVRCASDVIATDLAVRVMCEQRTLARMADPRKRALGAIGRVTSWLRRLGGAKKKKNLAQSTRPRQDVAGILAWA